MSWRSTSRPWNWHQHQHSAPHTPPRATYQHPDSQYRHEPPSPQETKQFNRDIPANFQPDANHFDTKQQYGLSFPRQVTSTAWSQKYHLAGRPIDSVRLYELAHTHTQTEYWSHDTLTTDLYSLTNPNSTTQSSNHSYKTPFTKNRSSLRMNQTIPFWAALLTYKNIHCLTFNQTMLGSFNLLALQLPHNISSLPHTAASA